VDPVSQNSIKILIEGLILVCLFLGFAEAKADKIVEKDFPGFNSPKEKLRLKLFPTPSKVSCNSIDTGPKTGSKIDSELDGFIQLILTAIRENDAKKMLPLFHKRMNVKMMQIQTSFNRLNSVYRVPFDVSIYRLWALNTVDGTPNGLSCNQDELTVYPLYGYPLQFGLWLQIMGQLELGRIYISLVPANGRWNIGSFHSQQWTHDSRDFATWDEEGQKNQRMGYPLAAYVKYDIAAKLLNGGGFIDIPMQDHIIKRRDSAITKQKWQESIKSILKEWNIAYTATMLVAGGGGVLARIRIDKEISLVDMKKDCNRLAKTLIKQPFHNYLEGVRCSYVLPRENPKKEGLLGGMFLSFSDLKPKQEG
jgi:hypothetical protein